LNPQSPLRIPDRTRVSNLISASTENDDDGASAWSNSVGRERKERARVLREWKKRRKWKERGLDREMEREVR